MEHGRVRCFASYSRRDSGFVEPVVSLLRSAGGHIFYDRTDISPGEKWNTVITNGLNEAQVLFVFWSKHASQSDYVRAEVETALNHKKTIVPVLLDDTELWDEIAVFQWVDFRGRTPAFAFPSEEPRSLAYGLSSWRIVMITFAILFAILIGSTLWTLENVQAEFPIYGLMMTTAILVVVWLIWKVVTFSVCKGAPLKEPAHVAPELWFEFAKELDTKARELVSL